MILAKPHIWKDGRLWWCCALAMDGRKFWGTTPASAYIEWSDAMSRKYDNS